MQEADDNTQDLYRISSAVHDWVWAHADGGVVVELGGGNGSPVLHERVPNCTTIESDGEWYINLVERGVNAVHAPLVDGWYEQTDEVLELLRTADVLIVDGPTGPMRNNFEAHMHHLKDGCLVCIDDTHRRPTRAVARRLAASGWELLRRLVDPFGRHTHCMQKAPKV